MPGRPHLTTRPAHRDAEPVRRQTCLRSPISMQRNKGVAMYAAVRRYEGITDDEKAGRLVRESFLPLLDKVQGFIAYYWIDAGDGAMASLSVFEDETGADESVKLAHQWVEENAATLIPNPPQVTEGLVVAHETK